MSIPSYPLTVSLNSPGAPVVGARVTAVLDRVETDQGGYIVDSRFSATTGNNGIAVLSLWPNSRGSGQSHYVVYAISADNTPLFEVALAMPERPCDLAEIAGPPADSIDPTPGLLERIQKLRNDTVAAAQKVGDRDGGASAYQVAVNHGFKGSVDEWRASLHGADGDRGPVGERGPRGYSAYEIAVNHGFEGSEQEWLDSIGGGSGDQSLFVLTNDGEIIVDASGSPVAQAGA